MVGEGLSLLRDKFRKSWPRLCTLYWMVSSQCVRTLCQSCVVGCHGRVLNLRGLALCKSFQCQFVRKLIWYHWIPPTHLYMNYLTFYYWVCSSFIDFLLCVVTEYLIKCVGLSFDVNILWWIYSPWLYFLILSLVYTIWSLVYYLQTLQYTVSL